MSRRRKPNPNRWRFPAHAAAFALLAGTSRHANANLVITPTFDSTITSDPNAAAIEAAINSAIGIYETRFANPVNITIDFQETTAGIGMSNSTLYNGNYSNFISLLSAAQNTPNNTIALSNLPSSGNNPVTNNPGINVKSSNLKALGVNVSSAQPGGYDGIIDINTNTTNIGSAGTTAQYSLIAVTEHEIDEVLGLGSALNDPYDNDPLPEDLFRYTSTGARNFTTVGDNAYFSLNGTTDLARFNQDGEGDYGDWWGNGLTGNPGPNPPPQVQDASYYPGTHPSMGVEFTALNVIGYELVDTAWTWTPTSGASWNNASNWNPNGVPNAPGTHVSFLTAAGGGAITLDSSQTVGQILFDSTASYTISPGTGANTLTIDDSTDVTVNPAINVNHGSHFITAPIILANGVNVNFLNNSGLTLSNSITGAGPVTVTGAGTLTLATTASLPAASSLAITSGAKVTLAASATPSRPAVQTVASLSFDTTAGSQLDVTSNEMIITGATPASIRADIISHNITSSLDNSTHGVGYIANAGGTEIRYTILGDTNLDGSVNFSDLLTLAANYGLTNATWSQGDFNYDGSVNFSDLLTLAANYGNSLSPSEAASDDISPSFATDWNLAVTETAATLPEPGSLLWLVPLLVVPLCRRRRRSDSPPFPA